jgi:hypothetical protein
LLFVTFRRTQGTAAESRHEGAVRADKFQEWCGLLNGEELTEDQARFLFQHYVARLAGSASRAAKWWKECGMDPRTRSEEYPADENLLELVPVLQDMWGGEDKLSSNKAIEKLVRLTRLKKVARAWGQDKDGGHVAMARLKNKVYGGKRHPPIDRGETALAVLLGGKKNAMIAMLRTFHRNYPKLGLLP